MDYPVLLALLPVLPADSCDSVWVEEPMREDSLPSRRHAAMSFARGKEVEPMSQAFFFSQSKKDYSRDCSNCKNMEEVRSRQREMTK